MARQLFICLVVATFLVLTTKGKFAAHAADAPWVQSFTAQRVIAGSAPDNNFLLLKKTLDSAKHSIHTAVYQLDNPQIAEAFFQAVKRGVKVQILFEGFPIPKLSPTEMFYAKHLAEAGAEIFFYSRNEGEERRFKYFHNKYSIVDGLRVIVGSANYGNGSHPINTSLGNREWEIVLDDPIAAKTFETAFQHDLKLDTVVPYGKTPRYTFDDPTFTPKITPRKGTYVSVGMPVVDENVRVRTVFAPDNALDPQASILATLEAAKYTVDIEQLTFETYWGGKKYNPEKEHSPLVQAVLKLGEMGRAVRILLNDVRVFMPPRKPMEGIGTFPNLLSILDRDLIRDDTDDEVFSGNRDNEATIQYIAAQAAKKHLNVKIFLLDYKKCSLLTLHNKGMIVDRRFNLVGSINWGESALKRNREAAVLVDSEKVAQYYTGTFEKDWRCTTSFSR